MAIKTKPSFFQMPGDKHARREWVYEPRTPIPIWVFQKWHNIGESNTLHHVDGRELRPGDRLVMEDSEFMIVRK